MNLYTKIKYAGYSWLVFDCDDDFCDSDQFLSENADKDNRVVRMVCESIVGNLYFDNKTNVFRKSHVGTFLNKDFRKKLLKRGVKDVDLIGGVSLLTTSEYEKIKRDGIAFAGNAEWWLFNPCSVNSNYVACVHKDTNIYEECVIYYNGIRPVISVPFMSLTERQRNRLEPPVMPIADIGKTTPLSEFVAPKEPVPEPIATVPVVSTVKQPETPICEEADEIVSQVRSQIKKYKIKLSEEQYGVLYECKDALTDGTFIDDDMRAALVDLLNQFMN